MSDVFAFRAEPRPVEETVEIPVQRDSECLSGVAPLVACASASERACVCARVLPKSWRAFCRVP
eukprot:6182084-Pleurochrysis_carterae.AAC.2